MKAAPIDQLVRFLNLAKDYGEPAEALAAFSRYSNAWKRNHPALRLPFLKLRIAAGEKERAISDAQCMWLASSRDGSKEIMREIGELLTSLGAKPLKRLQTPSEFIKFPKGTRIDLVHDQTIKPEFAAKVAREVANFWGCEVHVLACELDPTRLSSYNALSKAIEGTDFAWGIVQFPERPSGLLHTAFLTNHKLRSTVQNYTGDIYGCHSTSGSSALVSTYYFHRMRGYDDRPLERVTAIALAAMPVVTGKITSISREAGSGEEIFFTFNPDAFSSNGNLHMHDHMLGVAPSTGGLLEKCEPSELLKIAAERRENDRKMERAEPSPDAAYFREIASSFKDSEARIVFPETSN